jgi:hypothetical protein
MGDRGTAPNIAMRHLVRFLLWSDDIRTASGLQLTTLSRDSAEATVDVVQGTCI